MAHDPDLEGRLRALGTQQIEPELQSAHLAGMATAARAVRRRTKARVGGIIVAGVLVGSTSLAAAGALPDPAQHLAYRALDTVGVDVPDPERYHGPECGPVAKKNHGAYVRDDPTLAKSRCGKPVKAGTGEGAEEDEAPDAPKGPCQGPPPWAGKAGASMTPEEKAQARTERAAQCGEDDDQGEDLDEQGEDEQGEDDQGEDEQEDDVEAPEAPEATERQATTTTAPTTTTGPTTTTTESTTTTEPTTESTAPTGA